MHTVADFFMRSRIVRIQGEVGTTAHPLKTKRLHVVVQFNYLLIQSGGWVKSVRLWIACTNSSLNMMSVSTEPWLKIVMFGHSAALGS